MPPKPLTAPGTQLRKHFERNDTILRSAVDASAQLRVAHEFVDSGVVGFLSGSGCEHISRNRGRGVFVAPLLYLRQGLWVWLGYHEGWAVDRRHHRYSFRSSGLSIHFGLRSNGFKPQIFRAEWAGWAKWDGGSDYSYQAANAGHPHWHFDALDSLHDDILAQRAAQLLSRLKDEAEPETRRFSPALSEVDVRDVVTAQKVSRIHFASAAAWWKSSPHGEHAHGPADLADIECWIRHSVEYIKSELTRL